MPLVPEDVRDLLDNSSGNEAYWRKRLANQGELRAPPPKSLWRTFIDSFTPGQALEETMRRGPAGLIATYVAPLVETGDGKSYSERRKAFAAKEKARREDYDAVNAPKNAGEFIAELPASIVGSLISDPTNLVGGPAKSLGGKALTAAGVGGAADVALQGGEIASGLRDEFSPTQTLINTAAGPVFVAAAHGTGKAVDRVAEHFSLKEAAKLGREFGRVTSLTRTPEHNKKVGGVPNSYHVKGRAMDIARAKGVSHADIVREFKQRGYHLVEALDEGDHTHLAFDFKNPALAPAPKEAAAPVEESPQDFLIRMDDPNTGASEADMARLQEILKEADGDAPDNVVQFPQERVQYSEDDVWNAMKRMERGEISQDDFAKIAEQFYGPIPPEIQAHIQGKPVEDVLTPAERQDMDASVPAPPAVRGTLSEDIIDSIRGQGRAATTPVNDIAPEPGQNRAGDLYAQNSGTTGGPSGPAEPPGLLDRLTAALKKADSLKGEQADLAHAHRAKQALKMENAAKSVRGRARLFAMRHAQKGEIEKPGFSPIEDKFSPEEIDTMSDYISEFTGWTSIHDSANALDGWNKLLKGTIPTQSELALLEKVLPREAITAILKHMPRDTAELIADALNIPRSILSSFDISAPGRQGVFLVGRKEYWQGLPDMVRQFGSEEAHQAVQKAIREDPDFALAERAGLATQDTQVRLGGKEENFNSNLAEKYIPGVRMSDRSFSGYLHKLRFDVFKSIVENHRELGVDVTDPKYLKSLGAYINTATGRGDLPKMLERFAPFLNATLFSPRLMTSRLNLLANPVFWAKMHPKVRQEALKDLSRFTGVAGSILGLAALGGAAVSLDPNSSDFLKIKIGDRRYDVLGGFQQYMVLGSRIKEYLAGQVGLQDKKKGLEQTNLQNAPTRFLRTKLAPIPSAIIDSWLGKDVVGQDTNLIKEAFGLVTPMSAGDIAEAAYDDGLLEGAMALPSLGGVGYAKYEKKKPAPKKTPLNSIPDDVKELLK